MMKKILTLAFLIFSVFAVSADTQAEELRLVSFNAKEMPGDMMGLQLKFKGAMPSPPELQVGGRKLDILLENLDSLNSTKGSFPSKAGAIKLAVIPERSGLAKIQLDLPYQMKNRNRVSLTLKDNLIEIKFPIDATAPAAAKVEAKAISEKTVEVAAAPSASQVDEKYLEKLIEENNQKTAMNMDWKNESDTAAVKTGAKISEVAQAAAKKSEGGTFSLMTYIGKFLGFLALVLVFFYGIVLLMKKGVIKKGKLGLLTNTDLVSVLSTTYLGPKKALNVIKVHGQVFLIGVTDQNISLLSELGDVAELLKQGEKSINGSNFDSTFNKVDERESFNDLSQKVRLKRSENGPSLNSLVDETMDIKENVSLSGSKKGKNLYDDLKKKVKDLRPMN